MAQQPTPSVFAPLLRFLESIGGAPALLLTTAGQVVAAVLTLLTWSLAAEVWPPEDFGLYVVARRGIALLASMLGAGAFLALLRQAAAAQAESDWPPQTYLIAATTIVTAASGMGFVVVASATNACAEVLLGDPGRGAELSGLMMGVFGLLMNTTLHAYLLSQQSIRRAAALQVGSIALAPLACVAACQGGSVAENLWLLGIVWVALAATSLIAVLYQAPHCSWRLSVVRNAAASLLRYGLPRVPSDSMFIAMLTFPATSTANSGDLAAAGVLGFGSAMLAMLVIALRPCALLVTPAINRRGGAIDRVGLRRKTLVAGAVLGGGTLAASLLALPLMPLLIELVLGAEYRASAALLQRLVLAAPAVVVFVVVRTVLDSVEDRALSVKNLAICLALMWVLGGHGEAPRVAWSVVAAFAVLASLSVWDLASVLCPANQSPRLPLTATGPG